MKKVILAGVFVLFFLAACSNSTQPKAQDLTPPQSPPEQAVLPPQSPPVPVPDTNAAAAQNDAKSVKDGAEGAFGAVNKTTAIDVGSVKCDAATRTITFRFKNDDTKNWQLDNIVPFPAPADLAPVRLFVNSYAVNGAPYLENGETYFGPNDKFSKNCGGVEILKPGEDVTCTLVPVPLAKTTTLAEGRNVIFIDTPTSRDVIEFTC